MGYQKRLSANVDEPSVAYDHQQRMAVMRATVTAGLSSSVGRTVDVYASRGHLLAALRFAEQCEVAKQLGRTYGAYPRHHRFERADFANDYAVIEPCSVCGNDPDYTYHVEESPT